MNNINEKVRVERYSSILTKTRIDITEQKAIELQKHYLKNRKDKYIPPTIHKRKNLNFDKTSKKTYEIK